MLVCLRSSGASWVYRVTQLLRVIEKAKESRRTVTKQEQNHFVGVNKMVLRGNFVAERVGDKVMVIDLQMGKGQKEQGII